MHTTTTSMLLVVLAVVATTAMVMATPSQACNDTIAAGESTCLSKLLSRPLNSTNGWNMAAQVKFTAMGADMAPSPFPRLTVDMLDQAIRDVQDALQPVCNTSCSTDLKKLFADVKTTCQDAPETRAYEGSLGVFVGAQQITCARDPTTKDYCMLMSYKLLRDNLASDPALSKTIGDLAALPAPNVTNVTSADDAARLFEPMSKFIAAVNASTVCHACTKFQTEQIIVGLKTAVKTFDMHPEAQAAAQRAQDQLFPYIVNTYNAKCGPDFIDVDKAQLLVGPASNIDTVPALAAPSSSSSNGGKPTSAGGKSSAARSSSAAGALVIASLAAVAAAMLML